MSRKQSQIQSQPNTAVTVAVCLLQLLNLVQYACRSSYLSSSLPSRWTASGKKRLAWRHGAATSVRIDVLSSIGSTSSTAGWEREREREGGDQTGVKERWCRRLRAQTQNNIVVATCVCVYVSALATVVYTCIPDTGNSGRSKTRVDSKPYVSIVRRRSLCDDGSNCWVYQWYCFIVANIMMLYILCAHIYNIQ